jgi:cation diffusion facilitator CzcD-associated flavoprotein CzcO
MLDFIIVGGAQAGLSMAYYLNKLGKQYIVVDKESEIGASWLNRWDSLKLFTPSEFNNLPGMDFPAEEGYYPTKKDVAAYFKDYVTEFNIDIRLNTLVEQVSKEEDHFVLKHPNGELKTQNVIIATGPFHIPYTPSFSKKISEEGWDIKNIVWATGYRPNFSWIDGLELTKDGYPKHQRGISNIEGLYFIGLPWLHTRGSATLGGIKNDAKYLTDYIQTEENK